MTKQSQQRTTWKDPKTIAAAFNEGDRYPYMPVGYLCGDSGAFEPRFSDTGGALRGIKNRLGEGFSNYFPNIKDVTGT